MRKVVFIGTHGVTTTEGTAIQCLAEFHEKKYGFVSKFLYDERGVLEKVEHSNEFEAFQLRLAEQQTASTAS